MQTCKYTEMKRLCGHTVCKYRYRGKSKKINGGLLTAQRVLPLNVADREYYLWGGIFSGPCQEISLT